MITLALVLQVAVLLVYQESRYARNGLDVARQPGDWSQPVLLVSFIAALLSCLLTLALGWGYRPALEGRWLGEGLFLSGFVIRVLAIRTLGHHFTGHIVVRADHALIDTGLYRWVRHPSYTAAILELLGCVVMSGSSIALAWLLLGYIPGTVYRIRLEDGRLAARFGPQFETYRAQTKALLPFLL